MLTTLVLLGFVIVATVTDLWVHKIYNGTTYAGMAVALLLPLVATAAGRADLIATPFFESVLGLLLCGLVMLICFALFQIGGGDVKLLAMTGAFLGPEFGIEALLWTFVLGGAAAVLILIWKLGAVNLGLRVLKQLLYKLELGSWGPLTVEEKKQLQTKLYLAPWALAAIVIVQFSIVDRFMG